MEKQISIIIPTYNMEKYIGKCLDSLIISEFDQVEVLVVNDGSKDRSSEIAHEYANRYPNSIRVIDKENGNYGSCINAAVPLVTGRYVKILDADDTFDTGAFAKFVKRIKEIEVDAIITDYIQVDPHNTIVGRSILREISLERIIFDSSDIKMLIGDYLQMHRLTYRTSVLRKLNYVQTEGISYTDTQWSIIPLCECETFYCIKLDIYRYLIGREGQSMSQDQISKSINHLLFMLRDITNYYHRNMDKIFRRDLFKHLLVKRHDYIYRICLKNYTTCRNIFEKYDNDLKSIKEVYDSVGELRYDNKTSFKVFKSIRNKRFPNNYKIPFWVKAQISLKIKLNA